MIYVVNTIWDLTVINYTDVVDNDTFLETLGLRSLTSLQVIV